MVGTRGTKITGTLVNKIYRGNIGGRRSKGKNEKVGLENLEEAFREWRKSVWRRKAQDRNEWATIARQALVLHGS